MKRASFLALLGMIVLTGCDTGSNNSGTTAPPDKTAPAPGGGGGGEPIPVAFVTNNVGDFWTIAQKGVEKANSEQKDVKAEVQMPSDGSAAEQKRILEDLAAKGVKAIAVSPVDPKNQTTDLNTLADKVKLICHDSDAPDSKRLCYIGTDNVAAGRMCGEAIKKALPGGGKIMCFVGKADAQNAKERYQGIQESLKGSNVTILDLRTDDTDRVRAKQNVTDTITATPDIAGLVGLWSYNGPAIVNAVKEANKVGKIKIVCFDEEADTLAGIKDGAIDATVVQQPYEFGYQSVMMMAKLAKDDTSAIPADKKVIVETKVIDKASVEEFEKKLKELTGK